FSRLLQRTICLALAGISVIRFFGQALVQAPQAVHFSGSALATPSTIRMAPNLQAATQLPRPIQPVAQALAVVPGIMEAFWQSWIPKCWDFITVLSQVPEQRTKATFRSPVSTATPKISPMALAFSAPAGAQALGAAFPATMASAQASQPA